MTIEKPHGYAKLRSRFLRTLVRHPQGALLLHWVFQSLLYMDPTERWFKIGLDLLLTGVLGVVLRSLLRDVYAWPLAFLIAHTLNFLFNGQLWGVLKHYDGWVTYTHEAFCAYASGFRRRALDESAIERVVVYGSLARRAWSRSSDFDARIVRRPGGWNGVRACWFLLRERTRALLARFPLDVYVVDGEASLQKLDRRERPLNLTQGDSL